MPSKPVQAKLMKRPAMMKRPARAASKPLGWIDDSTPPAWRVPPGGADMPQWAPRWVNVLGDHLGGLVGTTLTTGTTLNVWSDCGGMSTEMFALDDITAAIGARYGVLMQSKLYCFCDNQRPCR